MLSAPVIALRHVLAANNAKQTGCEEGRLRTMRLELLCVVLSTLAAAQLTPASIALNAPVCFAQLCNGQAPPPARVSTLLADKRCARLIHRPSALVGHGWWRSAGKSPSPGRSYSSILQVVNQVSPSTASAVGAGEFWLSWPICSVQFALNSNDTSLALMRPDLTIGMTTNALSPLRLTAKASNPVCNVRPGYAYQRFSFTGEDG
jgi:hypothetical protein